MLSMEDIRSAVVAGTLRAPLVAAERQKNELRERAEQEQRKQAAEDLLWTKADAFLGCLPKKVAEAVALGQDTVDLLSAEDERFLRQGWCGKVLHRLQALGLTVTFRDDAHEDINSESPRWVGNTWMVVHLPVFTGES